MKKKIEDITNNELLDLFCLIGGTPHLVDQGTEELRGLLIDGDPGGLFLDAHTMAAIVDRLRDLGYGI